MKLGPKERALDAAVRARDVEAASRALCEGADPNAVLGGQGDMTALDFALMFNHPELTLLLLEAGANPNHCDRDGVSALSSAVHARRWPLARMLLEYGARTSDLSLLLFSSTSLPTLHDLLERLRRSAESDLEGLGASLSAVLDAQAADGAMGSD